MLPILDTAALHVPIRNLRYVIFLNIDYTCRKFPAGFTPAVKVLLMKVNINRNNLTSLNHLSILLGNTSHFSPILKLSVLYNCEYTVM